MSHIDEQFQDKMEHNMYFTLRGCEEKGYYKVPKILLNAFYNWSALCTDPKESEDFYKNPRAMFVALDLMYTMINGLWKHGLNCSKFTGDHEFLEWNIPKIQSIGETPT